MIFLTIFECYIIDYNAMKMTIKYPETVYKILPYLSNTDPYNINTNFASARLSVIIRGAWRGFNKNPHPTTSVYTNLIV